MNEVRTLGDLAACVDDSFAELLNEIAIATCCACASDSSNNDRNDSTDYDSDRTNFVQRLIERHNMQTPAQAHTTHMQLREKHRRAVEAQQRQRPDTGKHSKNKKRGQKQTMQSGSSYGCHGDSYG